MLSKCVLDRLINVKRDNTRIEEKKMSPVQTIKQPKFTKNKAKDLSGGFPLKKNCFFKDKVCFECGYVGHKSSHCRYKQKRKKQKFKTKVNVVLYKREIENGEKRKYVNTKINGHPRSDISTVNEQTWKKIGCPPLRGTKK